MFVCFHTYRLIKNPGKSVRVFLYIIIFIDTKKFHYGMVSEREKLCLFHIFYQYPIFTR